jgi:hypothetical protein
MSSRAAFYMEQSIFYIHRYVRITGTGKSTEKRNEIEVLRDNGRRVMMITREIIIPGILTGILH